MMNSKYQDTFEYKLDEFSFRINLIPRFLCLVCIIPVTVFLTSCYGGENMGSDWLNSSASDVSSSNKVATPVNAKLILPVARSMNSRAIDMLESNFALELKVQQAAKLLNEKTINPDDLLIRAYDDAEKLAKEKEETAKDPFFSMSASKRMLEQAEKYRLEAATAKSDLGKLRPYLVRAVVLNEGTGKFSAYLVGSELYIFHRSLGSERPPVLKRPVVVFLKSKPTKVYVGASMAK